ncbi:MAG: outer membrane lipoprotein chaperone LolA [Acidobacteriota bacterium]
MRLLPLSGFVALAFTASAGAQPGHSAQDVARAVQQRYDGVRDFTARFVHVYQGGVLRKTVTEKGTVEIKKPGRMRWEYTDPEKKVFVADGSQIYSYIPADRQVIVSPMPAEDQATTATLFLTGRGNLPRDFDVSFGDLPQAPAGTTVLKLVPRHAERDYDTLTLAVTPSNQIQMLSAVDRQKGRSTFIFSDIKENTELADKIFAFKIPRGVDVVRSGNTQERR